MYSHRRSSTSSGSSEHSHNSISKALRNARNRLARHQHIENIRRSPSPHFPERRRQSSTCSERSCSNITADEMTELWRCMLELQEEYGCYNSTRMELAMDAGEDALALMPSRFIIDTLNDSVVDLPDEGWEKLDRYLRNDASKASK